MEYFLLTLFVVGIVAWSIKEILLLKILYDLFVQLRYGGKNQRFLFFKKVSVVFDKVKKIYQKGNDSDPK